MLKVEKLGVILEATAHDFESAGVLNPAVIQEGENVKMLYRAFKDGNFSTIGYCEFNGPVKLKARYDIPVIIPEKNYEIHGVEDPRIVKIDGVYYITYTGYDGKNALGCLATSKDLQHFEKHGIITPSASLNSYKIALDNNRSIFPKYFEHLQTYIDRGLIHKTKYKVWDKDVVLFPEKIDGHFMMIHRLLPGMQWVKFKSFSDLDKAFWKDYLFHLNQYILMDPLFDFENMHIGAGAPPLKTKEGWLLINHSVQSTPKGRNYHATVALLDLKDPTKVTHRLNTPLFSPDQFYEKVGYVNNVCFPSGTSLFDDDLYVYYGAADNTIAVARMQLSELLEHLLKFPCNDH
ncbi:pesticidal protein Cry7Aa [Winogradskyella sp.]|uniref:glycoside hydrolase family 130 protein n=1 Tax=Winogradskyella sp. TaxID=1883156 RepID=UPI003BAC47D6